MGGSPLFNEMTGENIERIDYIISKFPDKPWSTAERRAAEALACDSLDMVEEATQHELLGKMSVCLFANCRELPALLQRLVTLAFVRNSRWPSSIDADSLSVGFLFDRVVQVPQVAVGQLARLGERWARADGHCLRCLEVMALSERPGRSPFMSDADSTMATARCGARMSVRNLDLVEPSGARLATDISFDVEAGAPLAVTGPSASGKSLLASALAGTRRTAGADSSVEVLPGAGPPRPSLMVVTQRPYLPAGRLLTQLTYPTLLKLPCKPPFELHVERPPEGVTIADLQEHFGPLAATLATAARDEVGGERVIVTFRAFDELMRALARPQDRNVRDLPLQCELGFRARDPAVPPAPGDPIPNFTRMRRCLQAAGVDHVLTKEPEGWLAKRVWEDVLSWGDQQRLALARLLYHQPAFALLDDCLSAVSAQSEKELLRRLCTDWDVTPIVFSQRQVPSSLFQRELRLGVPTAPGWQLEKRPSDRRS